MTGFHRFAKPVSIRWERGMQGVGDVERALSVMQDWVRETGLTPEIAAAYIVCAEVIDGTKSAEDARAAFILAARDRVRGE